MAPHRLTFLPGRQTSMFARGVTLREAALELGILLESDCGGIGHCGLCRVTATGAAGPITEVERDLLSPGELSKGIRLSCQATVEGDCSCTILDAPRLSADQIMTDGVSILFPFRPDTRKRVLEIPRPTVGDKFFDVEAVQQQLRMMEPQALPPSLSLQRAIPDVTRKCDGQITVTLDQDLVTAIEAGDTSAALFGVAFDIGTTTVVGKLVDLIEDRTLAVVSALNAQEPYGADIVSRAKYTIENPGGLERLHSLIIDQLNVLIEELCATAGIQSGQVYKCVVVGNTVMQHLALALSPHYLVMSPFTPAAQGPISVPADTLGLSMSAGGAVYFLPNLACFVGGDITAVLTTLDLEQSAELQLVVDIGTNGEIVLGSRDRIVCCSSPAGPAWEGATITWGMRAAYGAIERVDIEHGDLVFRTVGGGPAAGICGSGLMDLAALCRRAGIVDETGRILSPEEAPGCPEGIRGRIRDGQRGNSVRIAPVPENAWIELTQKDVREIQLAKAAIASGIEMLLKECGVAAADISRISIAGAFGNHIRGQDAVDIGLLPKVPADRIHFIGNAAAAGAQAILRSREAREKAERLARVVDYVEVAGRPDFQDLFVDCLLFP